MLVLSVIARRESSSDAAISEIASPYERSRNDKLREQNPLYVIVYRITEEIASARIGATEMMESLEKRFSFSTAIVSVTTI